MSSSLYDNGKEILEDFAKHPVQMALSSLPALAVGLPIYEYGDPVIGLGIGAVYFGAFYKMSTAESRKNQQKELSDIIK